jgi:hypothetical protein
MVHHARKADGAQRCPCRNRQSGHRQRRCRGCFKRVMDEVSPRASDQTVLSGRK